jgi:hypothetical protein
MATATKTQKYEARLKNLYFSSITPELQKELGLKNVFEVPRLEKIVINAGLGKAKDDKRILEVASNTLSKVTGQHPIETIARKSIASFKLREGSKVGLKVTLRDHRMYEFADRLINIVLPRLRDFRGVSVRSKRRLCRTVYKLRLLLKLTTQSTPGLYSKSWVCHLRGEAKWLKNQSWPATLNGIN